MTTAFNQIQFNAEFHAYTLNGQRLKNVTGLVSKLKNPFDREGLSAKKARERGVSVETILSEWDEAGRVSRERGTRVHQYIQDTLTSQNAPIDDPFLALNDGKLYEMYEFDKLWEKLSEMVKVSKIEWIIGDETFNLAGTVDAVFYGSTGFHIWDWKTGKEFKTDNPWGKKLLSPFGDLPECELITYSIQVSLYRLIIERNTDIVLGDSYLVHLPPVGAAVIHKAIDFRDRVHQWLQII